MIPSEQEIEMSQAMKRLIKEQELAGYVVTPEDIEAYDSVIETPTHFWILQVNEGSIWQYYVGGFKKATLSGHGDFLGCVEWEGDDYPEAVKALLRAAAF